MPKAGSGQSNLLVGFVGDNFSKLADPRKATEMAAYMKTDMPFYGVQKPQRLPIYKEFKKRFAPTTQLQYRSNVLALRVQLCLAANGAHFRQSPQPELCSPDS